VVLEETMSTPTPVPEVTVRGEAVLLTEPEIAELTLTALARARDRRTALERCRARQAEAAAAIAAAGDAVEATETTGIAVHTEIDQDRTTTAVASVQTRVTLTDFAALGELLVTLGEIDDVDVFGPVWRLRPQSPVHEQARLAAVRDAVHRAQQYARAFGADLVAVLAVSDAGLSGGDARVAVRMAAMARSEAVGPAFDLAPARQEVQGVVEVRFAMSPPEQEVFRG
jgi:uncharacterized protein